MRLAVIAAALLATSALATTAGRASDLPLPQVPPAQQKALHAPAAPAWGGLYVGGNFGYGFQNTDVTTTGAAGLVPSDLRTAPQGWLGGAQIGYNWQAGVFVFGAEADIDWANISATNALAAGGVSAAVSQKLDWISTYRARFGILPVQNMLVYATAGAAGGGVTTTASGCVPGCAATSVDSTQWGWTAGGGLEVMLNPNWSVKAEGLYYDLGQVNGNFSAAGATVNFNSDYKGVLGRLGFNYRF